MPPELTGPPAGVRRARTARTVDTLLLLQYSSGTYPGTPITLYAGKPLGVRRAHSRARLMHAHIITLHDTGVNLVIPQFECIWAKNARWASGRCEIVSLRPKSIPAELGYADNTPPVALHGRGLMCKHRELVAWWSAQVQQERPFGRARVKALNGSRSLKRIAVSAS